MMKISGHIIWVITFLAMMAGNVQIAYAQTQRKHQMNAAYKTRQSIEVGVMAVTQAQQQDKKPSFGAPIEGSMPKGETGAVKGFSDAWGFGPKK